MKENQAFTEVLKFYRDEIDEVDNQILKLLENRFEIVKKVKDLKRNNKEKFFIKPAREADMLKSLIKTAQNKIPESLIISIWRKIITNSNLIEQPFKIAVHNPEKSKEINFLIREYYSNLVPQTNFDSVNNTILDLEKNNSQIAVFSIPKRNDYEVYEKENWWINLANNKYGIKVFAKLPFLSVENIDYELVLLAILENEKSSDDNSLGCLEISASIGISKILEIFKEQKIDIKILQNSKFKNLENLNFYLIDMRGFFCNESTEIKKINKHNSKAFLRILGNYALNQF